MLFDVEIHIAKEGLAPIGSNGFNKFIHGNDLDLHLFTHARRSSAIVIRCPERVVILSKSQGNYKIDYFQ